MDKKIKTWLLRFPAKENPKMEKAFFDWPIVLQHDVKAKYRLISRKFSGMKIFHPSVHLNQIALFLFVSRLYENRSIEWFRVNVVFAQIFQPVENSTGTVWT